MPDLTTNVVVRAWEPTLREEGARFSATLVRRDITFQARTSGDTFDVEQITRPGLVIIGDDSHYRPCRHPSPRSHTRSNSPSSPPPK